MQTEVTDKELTLLHLIKQHPGEMVNAHYISYNEHPDMYKYITQNVLVNCRKKGFVYQDSKRFYHLTADGMYLVNSKPMPYPEIIPHHIIGELKLIISVSEGNKDVQNIAARIIKTYFNKNFSLD